MEITQYEQVINQLVVENQVVESVTDKLIKEEMRNMGSNKARKYLRDTNPEISYEPSYLYEED